MSLSDTDQYFDAIILPQLHLRLPRDIPQNIAKHSKSMKTETHTNKNVCHIGYKIQFGLFYKFYQAKNMIFKQPARNLTVVFPKYLRMNSFKKRIPSITIYRVKKKKKTMK